MPDLKPRIKNIVISNAIALNGGDAAILLSTMAILRRSFGEDVTFSIYDMAAAGSSARYPTLTIHPHLYGQITQWAGQLVRPAVAGLLVLIAARARRWPLIGNALRRLLPAEIDQAISLYATADLVVSSGGTYLVPYYSFTSKLFDFLFAEALATPLVLFTQSLGPFPPSKHRFLLRRSLRRAAMIFVRDERSREHLGELGVTGDHIQVCADAAFALASEHLAGRAFPPAHKSWQVAISVREWPHFQNADGAVDGVRGMDRYLDAMAALTTHLVQNCGARVTFLSTCQGAPEYWTDDSKTALEVRDRLPASILPNVTVDRKFRQPADIIKDFSAFDLTIATRLHAAILSLCAGTPVLPISYEFKTTELFTRFGLGGAVIDIEEISPRSILAAFSKASAFWTDHADAAWKTVQVERASAFNAGAIVADALNQAPGRPPSSDL